jgi:ribonuclease HI
MRPPPQDYLIAHTDGAARGNPGPAGYGVLVRDSKGKQVACLSQYLGRQTNNFAEYQGLIAALRYALDNGPRALKVISDSELLVRQIQGSYKVREPSLRSLHAEAGGLIQQLTWFEIEHVLRGQNRDADRLANAAIDEGSHQPAFRAPKPAAQAQEWKGIVRDGKIELLDGSLPEGTRVAVRLKHS